MLPGLDHAQHCYPWSPSVSTLCCVPEGPSPDRHWLIPGVAWLCLPEGQVRGTLESTLPQAQGVSMQEKPPTWKSKAPAVHKHPFPPSDALHTLSRKLTQLHDPEAMFKDKYKEL